MSTQTETRRRRTAADLRNRPTKRLLRDVAQLRARQSTEGLDAEEAADLRAIERELRGRTGGLAQ